MIETKMGFFVPISKLDEEQRMVYGVATCDKLDNQGEVVDYEATKDALKDYSNWRNIREMHKPSAVGVAPILELRDDSKELFIGAKIVDDSAWEKCKAGVYKGFSIGGEVLTRKVEIDKAIGKAVNRVTKYLLNEISVVDRPANPACKFQTVKRDSDIQVVTIAEDPLKEESARVMEKSITLAKKILSKSELEALPDSAFGLIKTTLDGDTILRSRMFPMPDNVHAINMVRKAMATPDLSEFERREIHECAKSVLGKKHEERECPYCVELKLKGGDTVEKDIAKGTVTISDEPTKRTVVVDDGKKPDSLGDKATVDGGEKKAAVPAAVAPTTKTADEQNKAPIATAVKPHPDVIDDEAPAGVSPAPAVAEGQAAPTGVEAKLDAVIALLQQLVQAENVENGLEQGGEPAMDAEAPVIAETGDAECGSAVVPAEVVPTEEKVVPEVVKTVASTTLEKAAIAKEDKTLNKVQAILEPVLKENAELKKRLEVLEKSPMPRREGLTALGKSAVKVEKYVEVKDVRLEKKDSTFSDDLQKDIGKASDMRKSGKALSADEQSFCERVANRMLEEKLSAK